MIMIAGRSGSGKSAFALFWVAKMNLPTLYLSGDMTGYQASIRLACMQLEQDTDAVEALMCTPEGRERVLGALGELDITFSFASPITWQGVQAELDAYVELHNAYPEVIVADNLMDFQGCETDYVAQSELMQDLTALSRETGSTIIVLHHATDKAKDADDDPGRPPSRREIKNGLAEKPEVALTVALDPHTNQFNLGLVKQRQGWCDPSAKEYVTLQAHPDTNTFTPPVRYGMI